MLVISAGLPIQNPAHADALAALKPTSSVAQASVPTAIETGLMPRTGARALRRKPAGKSRASREALKRTFDRHVAGEALALEQAQDTAMNVENGCAYTPTLYPAACAFGEQLAPAVRVEGRPVALRRAGAGPVAPSMSATPVSHIAGLMGVESQSAARRMLHAVNNALQCAVLRHSVVQTVLRDRGAPKLADGWYHALDLHEALQHVSGGVIGLREDVARLGAAHACTWRHTLALQTTGVGGFVCAVLLLRPSPQADHTARTHAVAAVRVSGEPGPDAWRLIDSQCPHVAYPLDTTSVPTASTQTCAL